MTTRSFRTILSASFALAAALTCGTALADDKHVDRIDHTLTLNNGCDRTHSAVDDKGVIVLPASGVHTGEEWNEHYQWVFFSMVDKNLVNDALADPRVTAIVFDFNGCATNENIPIFAADVDFQHQGITGSKDGILYPAYQDFDRTHVETIRKAGGFGITLQR
ncbi:hypothetical protein [Micavibrio aeruginosavorus]|uniref:hypothetical protein n=1 Tax=Micavibrio aeruginosavorus TaxID=349221 RepID=UPI003F4AF67C